MPWGNDMSRSTEDFVKNLVAALPQLEVIYREHLADNDELLPHVFMGEIARLVLADVKNAERAGWLSTLLELLESGLCSGRSEIAELIGVSFVENLCAENAAVHSLLPKLGEGLRKEFRSICGV